MTYNRQKTTIISADHVPQEAILDMWLGLKLYDMWGRFAFHEIRQRFRRSVLGPFWLTASMAVLVGPLGLIFSTLFQQDIAATLPYIAVGLIFWGLLTSCITEGSVAFISRDGYIRNVPMPVSIHIYQMLARNVIIWGFNMAIYFALAIYFRMIPNGNTLYFLISGPLLLINIAWMALFVGILSTRYRDIPQVIASLIQVVFFVTPIFWSEKTMPTRPAFVTANPLYHLIEIVREPLLGNPPTLLNWSVAVGLAIFGCMGVTLLYRRAQPRIAYWV